jgi:DNA-binding NarL/FixJ family response regulator
MLKAIVEVHNGKKYLCTEIKNILSEVSLAGRDKPPDLNSLTRREQQIAEMVRKGESSKEIASALLITLKTVEVHRHNILKKLQVRNSASLVNLINAAETLF